MLLSRSQYVVLSTSQEKDSQGLSNGVGQTSVMCPQKLIQSDDSTSRRVLDHVRGWSSNRCTMGAVPVRWPTYFHLYEEPSERALGAPRILSQLRGPTAHPPFILMGFLGNP